MYDIAAVRRIYGKIPSNRGSYHSFLSGLVFSQIVLEGVVYGYVLMYASARQEEGPLHSRGTERLGSCHDLFW